MAAPWLRVTLPATLFVMFSVPPATAQVTGSGTYAFNRAASMVDFTIYASMVFKLKREGRFKEFTGEVSYDPARPTDTRVDLTVYTASVDMNNPEHTDLLRSRDFFDVDDFPTMHFVSSATTVNPDGTLALSGDLTIRGVTKHITVPVTLGTAASRATPAATLETTFQIDRTEFGLNGTPKWSGVNVSIAKKVQIHIAVATVPNGGLIVR